MPSEITTAARSSELPAPPAPPDLRYRPHLDGVRAIAVYLVVAFHAGLGLLAGGFIGVDIFFVLSGYLVTSILVRDLRSSGQIRGRQFYARRVRRILPAAAATLLGTAVVYSIVASPAEVLDALGGFRAAFLYVANWYFIRQSANYFAANVSSNPVLQFWSLAVEEQFYLVWPLLFGGLYLLTARIVRWQWWLMRAAVVAAGAASMIAALHLAQTNLARAYYGTDTRAYQLLAGAALALTPQLLHLAPRWARFARWTAVVALAALVAVATSAFDSDPITRGVFVTALAVALLVALENAAGGAIKAMLSTGPFTYLGRISYGVYLWHWPVIVIAEYHRSLRPIELFGISCLVATTLAALSFRLLEQPIRMSGLLNRYKTPVIAVGFTASILLGVFAMPAMLDPGGNSVSAGLGASGSSSGPRLLDWRIATHDYSNPPDCLGAPVNAAPSWPVRVGGSCSWATATRQCGADVHEDREAAIVELLGRRVSHVRVGTQPTSCVHEVDGVRDARQGLVRAGRPRTRPRPHHPRAPGVRLPGPSPAVLLPGQPLLDPTGHARIRALPPAGMHRTR